MRDDALDEPREKFLVTLSDASAPAGVTIDPDGVSATGWIDDNDDAPAAKVANAPNVTEGSSSGTQSAFTVTLSRRSGREASVNYATSDGSAKAGEDYVGKSDVLKIPAGELSGTIPIDVIGDAEAEGTESFTLALFARDETATIGEPQDASATIIDDDARPKLSIEDARVKEGNSGTSEVEFKLRLSGKAAQRIVVRAITEDGSAVSPADYQQKVGTVTFEPGDVERVLTVLANGDTVVEPNETFFVNVEAGIGVDVVDGRASGTIVNDDEKDDDAGGGPVEKSRLLSVADASADEPTTGQAVLRFAVTLAPASTREVTVKWATSDGTATAGSDYVAAGGTLSFAPGETTQSVSVMLLADDGGESNETFFVNLAGEMGAAVADRQGMGTIVDRNAPPSLSISDTLARESEGATFTVELMGAALRPVSVTFSTSDGTAREGIDYLGRRATLTFAPGEKTKTVAVTVLDDALVESAETFSVNLGDPVNAVITKSRGVATIEMSDQPAPTVVRPAAAGGLPLPLPVKNPTKKEKILLPRMVLGPLTVTVNAHGVARMIIACKQASPVTCSGRVLLETAAKPKVDLGAKSFSVKRGKKAYIPLKLGKPALRLLEQRDNLRVRVIVFVKVGKEWWRVLPGVITVQSQSAATRSSSNQP
ncbi:MAG: hypothetical protein H0V79_01775 [Actinobacteria bacterium]|nr:hypothetical protein [Actinomycetota bacterium]